MFRYISWFLLILLVMGIFACNTNEKSLQSLLLKISTESNGYQISDYQVTDKTFEKSHQQGNYQALLLDSHGKKLHEISFQKIEGTGAGDDQGFMVSVPLDKNLHRIAIYQLDGRSGHYQRPDEALLTWTLPDSIKAKSKADR